MGNSKNSSNFDNSVLFVSLLAIFIFTRMYQPTIAAWVPMILLILGFILFVLGVLGYRRYRDVYDFEPTSIFGRSTNGQNARGLLRFVALAGGWLIVVGGFLMFYHVNTV